MLCSECGKIEAEVFLKQIVNNQVASRALCRDCAQDAAGSAATPAALLLQILAGLGGLMGRGVSLDLLKCKGCGLRYAQFKETGRLGCAECYEAFRAPLSDLLQRIHGAKRHSGKLPKGSREERDRSDLSQELSKLQKQLHEAVSGEQFEEAARIRDRIKRLGP